MKSLRRWRRSRFDRTDGEPFGGMTNLLDIMLVFACGLMAALVLTTGGMKDHFKVSERTRQIEKGREIPQLPEGIGQKGAGYEPVGSVYRHSETGKLILVGESK